MYRFQVLFSGLKGGTMANTLTPEERRDQHVKIYMTRGEREALLSASEAEGMSESEFGRVAIRYIINMMSTTEEVRKREDPVQEIHDRQAPR
jgi:hypothetical protein